MLRCMGSSVLEERARRCWGGTSWGGCSAAPGTGVCAAARVLAVETGAQTRSAGAAPRDAVERRVESMMFL